MPTGWKIHPGHSVQPHPSTFAFSGFEGAQTAAALLTQWQPVGPESCWGSAVSDACPPDGKFTQATAFEGAQTAPALLTQWHPAGVLLFRMRAHRMENSPRPQRPAPSIHGAQTAPALLTQWQPVGPASCWGSAVSDACVQPHPSTFAFSGFEGAQTASALLTQWQPVGPESCWGSAVSDACPPDGKFTQATASSPIHPPLL